MAPSTINVHLTAIRRLAAEAAEAGWLLPEVASRNALKGKRDRAVFALLVGCGLRRAELPTLTLEQIQQREARWVLADLTGKGRRVRTVPVPAWVETAGR